MYSKAVFFCSGTKYLNRRGAYIIPKTKENIIIAFDETTSLIASAIVSGHFPEKLFMLYIVVINVLAADYNHHLFL